MVYRRYGSATFKPHRRKIGAGALILILAINALAYFLGRGGQPAPSVGADLAGAATVIDGDTLEISGTRIRLHGIDAPESHQSCTDAAGRRYPCGREATAALKRRIGFERVSCERRDVDAYHRIVAVCRSGQIDLNGWMVENGWAVAYRHYSGDYIAAEQRAEAARAGIWAGSFENPGEWRRRNPR